jgi:hypothetical protein
MCFHSRVVTFHAYTNIILVCVDSSWLLAQRSRVRFPALPDFLSNSESGTGSTQPL